MITREEAEKVRDIEIGEDLSLDGQVARTRGVWKCVEKNKGSTILAQRRNGYIRTRLYRLDENLIDMGILRDQSGSRFKKYDSMLPRPR